MEEEHDFKYSLVIPRWVRHSNHPISTISIHPSGEIFATGGWDNYVKIWSFPALENPEKINTKLIALLRDHTGTVNCIRFSPNGKYLATCGDDSMVFLWQRVRCFGTPSTFGIPESALKPNKPIQKWTSRAFTGHDDDVTSVSWSPDSKRIASCSIDGCIIVWDINSGTQIWNYRTSISALSISWDPLNKFIAVQLSDGPLSIFDTQGRFVKEINECLENLPDKPMFFRTSWSPDGSFIGAASGYNKDDFNSPFFQRGSFKFAFLLKGHVSPISCVSCSPFLLHLDDNNYGSMFAIADKQGTLSIWNIGGETKPFLVLERLSPSCINDIAWSIDGKWLLVALENDPIQHIGGIICVKFLKDFPYEIADQIEMEEIKGRLLGETSFKLKSCGKNISNILQSLEIKEKEVDLEVLQLTTEEVLKRQVETVVDGIHTIQPVLLTAVEKKMISFHCNIQEKPKPKIPCEFLPPKYNWPKPSALINTPSKIIEVNDSLIIASDMYIYKLNKSNGRRTSLPFLIGRQCRHLSVEDNIVLAVGDQCYLLDLSTMKCVKKYQCPSDFFNFTILSKDVIIARSRCKTWIYDQYSKSWIGGGVTKSMEQLSMKEIEEFANWKKDENAINQWFEFGIDCLFASYCGQKDRVKETLNNMIEDSNSTTEKQYLKGIFSSIESNSFQKNQ